MKTIENLDKSNMYVEYPSIKAGTKLILNCDEVVYFKQGNMVFKELDKKFNYYDLYFRLMDGRNGFQVFNFLRTKMDDGKVTTTLEEGTIKNKKNLDYKEYLVDRSTLEEMLDPESYDGFYILNKSNAVRVAYNKKDGFLMGAKAIPSDSDIETMEYANRINLASLGLASNLMPKSIDEIRNFRIYGDYPTIGNDGFEDLLITAKNGSMDMEFFTIDYLGNNKFLLRTKSVLSQSNVLNQKYIDIKANTEPLARKLFKF